VIYDKAPQPANFFIKEAFYFSVGGTCSRDNVLAVTYCSTESSQQWQKFHKEEVEMTSLMAVNVHA
jgi:hypothetical protein